MARFLDGNDVAAFGRDGRLAVGDDRRAGLRTALVRWGQFGPGQTAGRFWPTACVALEVTQRCNLDCSLCYLSEHAEAAHDVPMAVLVERIAMLENHYGAGTSIQLTGGDPTLRCTDDLVALCREIRARGMRSCLMTNGIKATRPLLSSLRAAGLDDVAFHVDLTQKRPGHASETELNEVRMAYLDRARGLGLRVLFNTTVFDGNIDEVTDLARFFRVHADVIALASFQLQADAGRGVLGSRPAAVTPERVVEALRVGFATPLDFDVARVGHASCNRYATVLVAGAEAVSPLRDRGLFFDLLEGLDGSARWRGAYLRTPATLARLVGRRPGLVLRLLRHVASLGWALRRGLVTDCGRVHRLSLLVHDFMDASALQRDRCECCVFKVATRDGPLSMCVHNAQRDRHVFAPTPVATEAGQRWWDAGSGTMRAEPGTVAIAALPAKRRKGRARKVAPSNVGRRR
ncbi:MAG: radical SAM protein [Pseudomonadota bacterium]